MNNNIKLRAPLYVLSDDVEKAWFEQAKDEPVVAQAYDHLRGAAAKRAADELNQALDVDLFELLASGWANVPAVRNAVQLSVLMPGQPAIVRLEQHTITSTSYPVLNIKAAHSALPELKLTLEFIAGVQSATLAAQDGRIEVVALGKVSIIARLKYKSALVKEHSTSVEGALRDPFKPQRSALDRQAADVDFYI